MKSISVGQKIDLVNLNKIDKNIKKYYVDNKTNAQKLGVLSNIIGISSDIFINRIVNEIDTIENFNPMEFDDFINECANEGNERQEKMLTEKNKKIIDANNQLVATNNSLILKYREDNTGLDETLDLLRDKIEKVNTQFDKRKKTILFFYHSKKLNYEYIFIK